MAQHMAQNTVTITNSNSLPFEINIYGTYESKVVPAKAGGTDGSLTVDVDDVIWYGSSAQADFYSNTYGRDSDGNPQFPGISVSQSITTNDHTLTIAYVKVDGTEAADTHVESLDKGDSYSVTSPEVTGFTPSSATVTGTMGEEDVVVAVVYVAG